MNKKIFIPLTFIGLLVISIIVLDFFSTDDGKEIHVVTLGDYAVLNTVQTAFENSLESSLDNKVAYKIIESSAQGNTANLPSVARQVAKSEPYLIVTISTPVTQQVMRQINSEQKLVYTFVTNPDDLGEHITTTNSTGLSDAVNYSANIKLIQDILGEDISVGIIYNPNEANSVFALDRIESILEGTDTKLITSTATNQSEVSVSAENILNNVDAIYVTGDNLVVRSINTVLNKAYQKDLPVFASDEGSIQNGAIGGVSVDYRKLGEETANVVLQVINGVNPREISRRKIAGDKIVFNMQSIEKIDITIPDSILARSTVHKN